MTPGASQRQKLTLKHQREGIAVPLTGGFTGKLLETLLNRFHLLKAMPLMRRYSHLGHRLMSPDLLR